jgi:hypothetical protein
VIYTLTGDSVEKLVLFLLVLIVNAPSLPALKQRNDIIIALNFYGSNRALRKVNINAARQTDAFRLVNMKVLGDDYAAAFDMFPPAGRGSQQQDQCQEKGNLFHKYALNRKLMKRLCGFLLRRFLGHEIFSYLRWHDRKNTHS